MRTCTRAGSIVLCLLDEGIRGNAVFETSDVIEATVQGYDGMQNGKAVNSGVFVYFARVTFSNGEMQDLRGNVTIVR